MTDTRTIVLVTITNNPQSEPPLELIMIKPKGFKFVQGVALAGVFLLGVGGSGSYTAYAESGGLAAAGYTLNTATGEITGTASASGNVAFTGSVTDSAANSFSLTFSLDVISQLGFEQTSPPSGEKNAPYSYQFNITGATGSVTYAVTSGSVPAGLSLSSGGLLSGTPSSSGSTSNGVITATDSGSGATLDIPFSIFIYGELKPKISSAHVQIVTNVATTLNIGEVGFQGGAPNYVMSLYSGTLPAGLSYTVNPGQGGITFTATAPFTSTFLQFQVTDALGYQTLTSGVYITALAAVPSADAGNGLSIGTDGALYASSGGGGSGADPIFRIALSAGGL